MIGLPEYLERVEVRCQGVTWGLCPALGQDAEDTSEIALRHCPLTWNVVARVLLESGLIGGDRLLETLRSRLAFTERPKGIAEVVLRTGPIERDTLAQALLQGVLVGRYCVEEPRASRLS